MVRFFRHVIYPSASESRILMEIYDIKTITSGDSETVAKFTKDVWDYVSAMQEQGLKCEVQYQAWGGQYGSYGQYGSWSGSAMVICYRTTTP